MTRSDTWSADWACKHLINHEGVANASARGTNQIELIIRELANPVLIATMAVDTVTETELRRVCNSPEIQFAANIKADALFNESAIRLSESIPIGIGGFGDLNRAITEKKFRDYLPKETRFILRALKQKRTVNQVVRINNLMYRVARKAGSDILVLNLNEYDLTAEAVRDGIDRFGKCDIILSSNPYARPTSESISAAKDCGVAIMTMSQLLGALDH